MQKKILFIWLIMYVLTGKAQDATSSFTFSGYLEMFYLYNFNNPASHNQPSFLYSFNRSNEFNLNLGYIKANYSSDKVRANLALMTGTYGHANLSAEPEVFRNLF